MLRYEIASQSDPEMFLFPTKMFPEATGMLASPWKSGT